MHLHLYRLERHPVVEKEKDHELHEQETGVRALQGELWSEWVGRVGD